MFSSASCRCNHLQLISHLPNFQISGYLQSPFIAFSFLLINFLQLHCQKEYHAKIDKEFSDDERIRRCKSQPQDETSEEPLPSPQNTPALPATVCMKTSASSHSLNFIEGRNSRICNFFGGC